MTIEIARLREQDIPATAEFLIEEFHAEYADRLPPVNRQKVFVRVFGVWRDGFAFVARRDGEIVGSIGAVEVPYWYADATFFMDAWLYIARPVRSWALFSALMKPTEEWAAGKGKKLIIASTLGDEVDRKDALFDRAGFRRVGGVYAGRADDVLRQ